MCSCVWFEFGMSWPERSAQIMCVDYVYIYIISVLAPRPSGRRTHNVQVLGSDGSLRYVCFVAAVSQPAMRISLNCVELLLVLRQLALLTLTSRPSPGSQTRILTHLQTSAGGPPTRRRLTTSAWRWPASASTSTRSAWTRPTAQWPAASATRAYWRRPPRSGRARACARVRCAGAPCCCV